MVMTHNQTVRGLQILNHIVSVIGISAVVMTGEYYLLLVALLTYWFIGVFGINIGYHRLLSHRSFKTYGLLEKALSLIGVVTTVGSPLAWVTIHRQHHRSCERPGDPHSPYILGNTKAWFGFWDTTKLEVKLIRDFRKNMFQRWLHKHYLSIIIVYCLALALINPWLVIFVYALPACLCLHSSSSIIVIAHKHGYKTYDLKHDESRNSWIANIITLGEGWHNNHHAKPYAWSNWEKWWEWDIPALIIWVIKK
jgi:stearoyl-CoA desaturase (delta-9 desaturase)